MPDPWVSLPFDGLKQDARFALRALRKNPAFAAIAVLTLAAGIAANSVIFSFVSGVLLRPLPYRDSGRLVTVLRDGRNPVTPGDFLEWQQQARSFERMAGARAWSATLAGRERAEQTVGLKVTDGLFDVLGVNALHGRTFLAEESQPGREHAVVLSHGLWQRRYGGDPSAVGQTVLLSGVPYTIVGVMPPGFRFAPFWITEAELWVPHPLAGEVSDHRAAYMRVFARLKDGVDIASAQAEINGICKRLEAAFPETNTGVTARVNALHNQVVGDVRPALLVLLGAVGFVLLIACSNVASLSLARALERRKEIGVRLALGATRARLLRQLLTESVLLATVGGVLGMAGARWGLAALKLMIEEGAGQYASRLPRVHDVQLDWPVLVFTVGVSLATGILSGLAPALASMRTDVNESLKDAGRGTSAGGRSLRLRSALVVSQVAICLVLLAGAGLLLRSFAHLRGLDPGFNARGLLTMTVSLSGRAEYRGARRDAFHRQVVERVKALPGVREAAMTNHLPIGGDLWGSAVLAEGSPLPRPGQNIGAAYRVSRPEYFRTMGIALLRGRDFDDRDDATAPPVVIINETLARRLWPDQDPVGKRLSSGDPRKPNWRTVVGVVRDARQSSWSEPPDNEFYVPFQQDTGFYSGPFTTMTLVVRTAGDPLAAASSVQAAIAALDKGVAVSEVRSMEQVVAASLWQPRFHLLVLGLFAAFGIVLAAVGIYGVMAYSVSRRTREIGIRMALGARQSNISWMVLRQGLTLVMLGISIGLVSALALARSLATLVYGVSTSDPVTFAAVPLGLAVVALLAGYLPARRAARVAPVIALRSE